VRRNTPRIDSQRSELTFARQDLVLLCDASASTVDAVNAFDIPHLLDFATTDAHIVLFAERAIHSYDRVTGEQLAVKVGDYLDPAGHAQISSACPELAVWAAEPNRVIRFATSAAGISIEDPPVDGQWILPVAANRWLSWTQGTLRLWRTIGDAWENQVGDAALPMTAGQVVLNAHLLVLIQKSEEAISLFIVAMSDGTMQTQLRFEDACDVRIATKKGYALVRTADDIQVVDLRLGRISHELYLPIGVDDFAIDDSARRIGLFKGDGVDVVEAESLTRAARQDGEYEVPPEISNPVTTDEIVSHDEAPVGVVWPSEFPSSPLLRLDPLEPLNMATAAQSKAELYCALDVAGQLFRQAIARAWDSGQLSRQSKDTLWLEPNILGLMGSTSGLAIDKLREAEDGVVGAISNRIASDVSLAGMVTPLGAIRQRFGLSANAETLLVILAAPHIEYKYTLLLNLLQSVHSVFDHPFHEHTLRLLFKPLQSKAISRELDDDMPLRKYGIIIMGKTARPHVSLTVEPMILRYISGLNIDGEIDPHVVIRSADRNLEELQMAPDIVHRALTELSHQAQAHVRMAVRGRTGSGRHALLAALASRAGRDLGVIDITAMLRGKRLAGQLRAALQRAQLRSALPCVDGLEATFANEEPDTKLAVARVLRQHPGPLAVRLPPEAQIPLDPGYLLYDIRSRTESERGDSWRASIERHAVGLSDASELASRYRVGPGIVERVVSEVAHRYDPPATPAQWNAAFDQSVRQYLENKLGHVANRVTRLSTWSDIVLPTDIIASLTELTARVRHRKRVYETWGFDKSMTSSRGITALFAGTPGTGKTMVAGVIARELGLDVYRVDVSRITSKWIGETEKNLGSLFDAAEDGQVMLLFDEADSLFGKRTEAKTSNDRYANMETNYLLQRLDTFEGIAILTTNFGTAIDPAFKRRLTYSLTFPFPDEEMRAKLWAALIPSKAPIRGPLDFASLASRFRLSGGYIRNAVLRAAFLAIEEGAITQDHLERAVRIEFRELGLLTDSGAIE
jgi:hypothetical protein